MKKAIYMMAAAAIALSSCSSDETKDVAKSSNITFRASVGKNTRGAELAESDNGGNNMTKLIVSAFNGANGYFENMEFTKKGSAFESATMNPTWPKEGTLDFVAYSYLGTSWGYANKPTLSKDGATMTGFAPKTSIKEQEDIVFAKGSGSKATNEAAGVELNFEHILSQIKIQVKNTDPSLKYKIMGIRIASVSGSADYTFSPAQTDYAQKHAWTNPGTANVKYETFFENPVVLSGDGQFVDLTDKCNTNNAVGGAMLIPQTVTSWAGNKTDVADNFENFTGKAYISLLINVKRGAESIYPSQDTNGSKYGWAAVAIPAITWAAGNKYIYTLDMTKGCGKVDPVEPNPGTGGPDGGVEPDGTKDPVKGDTIFGKTIKFTVRITKWIDAFAGGTNGKIDM